MRAELEGVGEAGARGFGRLSREMEAANTRLAAFSRRVAIAAAAAVAAAAAAGVAMVRSGLQTVDAQAKLAQSLGTTVASIQTLERAGELAGVSMSGIEQATKDLIGGFIGSTIGSVVDSWIISSLAPTQRIEGARMDNLRITSATEGAVIPRLYGRMRIGGNIVWATDFREETKTTTQGGGKGGGGGGKVKTTEYFYYASFAVALSTAE